MLAKVSEIKKELKEVEKLVEKLEKSGTLPQIELDLARTKLQNIYSGLLNISEELHHPAIGFPKYETHKHDAQAKPDAATKNADNKSQQPVHEKTKIKDKEVAQPAAIAEKNNDLIVIDDQKEEVESQKKQVPPDSIHHEKHESTKEQVAHKQKEILAEKYSKNQTFINELLAQGYQKKDISTLMQSKSIKNIASSIGVNERFLFVKELFSGDDDTYTKTITILDNSANFNEAFTYIHSTFSWDLENDAAQKLLDLVRRRFIVDEE
jgi:hypothetical protein